ncbi:hypothetical protein D3C74_22320 [compost metagenome]
MRSNTIRTELQHFMQASQWNINQLSKESGINPGTLSSLINGNKIIAVDQLDRITEAMQLQPGHFYENYIQECLIGTPLNWRRMKPFLYRCANLAKLDCLEQVVSLLMDNLVYPPLLFDTAEDFFQDGKQQAALMLYENVAASEWKQHSERLALCQYRIFSIKVSKDQAQNLQIALQFEPYVERLSESNQLEALKDLINTYRFLRVWDKVEVLASTLEKKASTFYLIPQRLGAEKYDKPLFAYIAQSYLVRANVCEVNKDYQGALSYIRRYSDMSWVRETDEHSLYWINKFQDWAKANVFVIELLQGNFNVLDDYIDYMKTQNEEMLTALLNITKAANCYNHNIDHVIQHYGPQINQLLYQQQESSIYKDQAAYDRYVNLLFELSKYYLQRGIHSHAKEYLQNAITQALAINNRNTYTELCKIVQGLTATYAGE